uniref:Tigger transposable element derived 5-like n=1 Tax=Saccoglossus kowalevskii TaxID=10224 RepID=A0ABM0MCY1_SACKO
MKKIYHRNMLRAIVDDANEDKNLQEIIKTFTVKDALFMIVDGWDKIKPSTIQGCWFNGLRVGNDRSSDVITNGDFVNTDIVESCRELGLGELNATEIDEWISSDNNISSETFSEEEIIDIVTNKTQETAIEEDIAEKENLAPAKPPISVADAVNGLQLFMDWYEAQDTAEPIKLMQLHPMQ